MEEPTVAVGRVTRAHATSGEVAVLVLSEVEGRFADDAVVYLEDGRPLTVQASRSHRGRLLVKFREVRDRTQAQALVGSLLVVPESASPELPDGSWWEHQLVGCSVVTAAGRTLGTLTDVIHTGANDVWVAVDSEGREVLVPVLRDVVASVDIVAKRIVVHEIPGLTVEE